MLNLRKRIVTDETNRPVAVQIDYADWCKIEEALGGTVMAKSPTDLARHMGKLDWPVDGLEYQQRVRSAWN
jgi:hypothetical protein